MTTRRKMQVTDDLLCLVAAAYAAHVGRLGWLPSSQLSRSYFDADRAN